MEQTRTQHSSTAVPPEERPAGKPARRISILGVAWRLLVAVAILGGAIYFVQSMIAGRPEPVRREARERSFTVAVVEPAYGKYAPTLNTYGQVLAARTFEARAPVAGTVSEIAPGFSVGATVEAGQVLGRVDDFNYAGAVTDAEAVLEDARLQLSIAEQELSAQQEKLRVAREQLGFANRDLERARSLLQSGSVTDKTVEDRELLVSQRAQAVAELESAVKVQASSIARQHTTITRAEWTLAQARRALAETAIRAPFDARVVSRNFELGSVINANEVVAELYERDALEVRFVIPDQQYGQLLSEGLIGREITATWNIDPEPLTLSGKIVRAGAEVDASLGGVEIYAQLEGEGLDRLRPGAFVSVTVPGIAYENALRVPESALYENDHIYVIRDKRMARIDAELLARDGDGVIIRAEVPEGERIITTRVAQAGDGLLVTVEGEEPQQVWGARLGAGAGVQAGQRGGQRPSRAGDDGRPAGAPGGPPSGEN